MSPALQLLTLIASMALLFGVALRLQLRTPAGRWLSTGYFLLVLGLAVSAVRYAYPTPLLVLMTNVMVYVASGVMCNGVRIRTKAGFSGWLIAVWCSVPVVALLPWLNPSDATAYTYRMVVNDLHMFGLLAIGAWMLFTRVPRTRSDRILAWFMVAGCAINVISLCSSFAIGGESLVNEVFWFFGFPLVMNAVGVCTLMSSVEDAQEELKRQARIDPLSGVLNRRSFEHLGKGALALSRRLQHPVCLLYADLDNFKSINDRYGHGGGDAVIRHFANVCGETLRETDIFARMGGEEFAFLLVNTAKSHAKLFAERLRRAIEITPCMYDGLEIPFTVSIGVSGFSRSHSDLESMLDAADKALYLAKRMGRNRSVSQTGPLNLWEAVEDVDSDERETAKLPAEPM